MTPKSAPPVAGAATTTQRWTLGTRVSRSPEEPQRRVWTAPIRRSVAAPSRPPTTPTATMRRKKRRSSRLARPKRRARVKSSDPAQSRKRRSQPRERVSMRGDCIKAARSTLDKSKRAELLFHKHAHLCIIPPEVALRGDHTSRDSADERPPPVHWNPTAEVPPRGTNLPTAALPYRRRAPRPEGTGFPVPFAFSGGPLPRERGVKPPCARRRPRRGGSPGWPAAALYGG